MPDDKKKKKKKLAGPKDTIDVGKNVARFKRAPESEGKRFFSRPGVSEADLSSKRSQGFKGSPESTIKTGTLAQAEKAFKKKGEAVPKGEVLQVPAPLQRLKPGSQLGGTLDPLREQRQQELETGQIAVEQEVPLGGRGRSVLVENLSRVEGREEDAARLASIEQELGRDLLPEELRSLIGTSVVPPEERGTLAPLFQEQRAAEGQRLIEEGLAARQQEEVEEPGKLSLIERAADLGLEPAELVSEIIGKPFSSEQLAKTTGGKIVGLTTLGVGAFALGYAALKGSVLAAGTRFFSSRGLFTSLTNNAAGGRITQAALQSARALGQTGIRGAMNTVRASKITRMVTNLKVSSMAKTAIGLSLFATPFSWNEKNDAITTLSIAQRTAAEMGDIRTVLEIQEEMQQIRDGLFTLRGLTPILNNYDATVAKGQAAYRAGLTYSKTANEALRKIEQYKTR